MGALRLLLVGTLLPASVAGARPPRPSASASVAGGYDDNLNGATAASDRVGSAVGQLRAALAASIGTGRTGAKASIGYSGRAVLAVPDLSSHGASLHFVAFHRPIYAIQLSLAPHVGGRWVVDDVRSGLDAGADLGVNLRASRALSGTVGYGLAHRVTRETVFGGTTHTAWAAPELRAARRTYIVAEYALSIGPMVRYETVGADGMAAPRETGSGSGSGDQVHDHQATTVSTVFAPDEVAVRVPAFTHTVLLDIEQGVTRHLYVRVFGGLSWTTAEGVTSRAAFAQGSLGFRVP